MTPVGLDHIGQHLRETGFEAELLDLIRFAARTARGPLAKPSPDWPARWRKLLPDVYPEKADAR